jgi:23S rRNA (cytidine2498-2'-O)-methyltransferase
MTVPAGDALFCTCRAGFEPELAGELTHRAAHAGIAGYARTQRNTGFVEYISEQAAELSRALPFDTLIFARQKLLRLAELRGIDPRDRITPILEALGQDPAAEPGRPGPQLRQCAASGAAQGRRAGPRRRSAQAAAARGVPRR